MFYHDLSDFICDLFNFMLIVLIIYNVFYKLNLHGNFKCLIGLVFQFLELIGECLDTSVQIFWEMNIRDSQTSYSPKIVERSNFRMLIECDSK